MSYNKPFHRNYRPVISGRNSGYSDWAYIVDREYAQNPEHYLRAFSIIQEDIMKLFEYVEPSDTNNKTYSFRIQELLIRTCIEVEANFKAIMRENTFNPIYKNGEKAGERRPESKWNIHDFMKVNKSHHLSAYSIELPYWKGIKHVRKPFQSWHTNSPLSWYQAYNETKHDRLHNFEKANLDNLIDAFAGLFILLSSQFRTESFSTGGQSLGVNTDSYFSGNFGIGGFLMVHFPDDWGVEDKYDFDWAELKKEQSRFEKIDYDHI
jgi:hypothetical protein